MAADVVGHGLGDEDLARLGLAGDASGEVDDPADEIAVIVDRLAGPGAGVIRSRWRAASDRSISASASPTCVPARVVRSICRRRRLRRLRSLKTPATTKPRSTTSTAAAARITQIGQKPSLRASVGFPAMSDSSANEPLVSAQAPTTKPQTATEMNRWTTNRCTRPPPAR